jgi:hypothetical protein
MCISHHHLWRHWCTTGLAGVSMKTMGELENENSDGFRNPVKSKEEEFVLVLNTTKMREWDRTHVAIETEAERNNKEEYPDDGDEE